MQFQNPEKALEEALEKTYVDLPDGTRVYSKEYHEMMDRRKRKLREDDFVGENRGAGKAQMTDDEADHPLLNLKIMGKPVVSKLKAERKKELYHAVCDHILKAVLQEFGRQTSCFNEYQFFADIVERQVSTDFINRSWICVVCAGMTNSVDQCKKDRCLTVMNETPQAWYRKRTCFRICSVTGCTHFRCNDDGKSICIFHELAEYLKANGHEKEFYFPNCDVFGMVNML